MDAEEGWVGEVNFGNQIDNPRFGKPSLDVAT